MCDCDKSGERQLQIKLIMKLLLELPV